MMLLLLVTLWGHTYGCSDPIQCFTDVENEPEPKMTDCGNANYDCKGPNFVTTTGYSSMEQECGECTASEIGISGCQDCTTEGCNAVKELEDMICNEYEWKTDKFVKKMEGVTGSESEVLETCKKFQGEDDVCRRPIGGVLDTLTTFCGDCPGESAAVCTNTPAPIQCFTVAQGETEAKITDCEVGEGYCKGPNFVTTTGYSYMGQRCGECTSGETSMVGCQECNTDGCNIKKELEDMKCNKYVWKTDKWVKKMEGVTGSEKEVLETCKKFQGEDDVCRRPIDPAYGELTFCGDCTPESAAVCTNAPAPIQCFTVAQGETEAKITDCDEGEGYCKGPNFVTTTGYASMGQKCGECTEGETRWGCKECNTDGCNIKKELEDMKCNEYVWKTDKWVKKMEGVTGSETEVLETCKKFQGEDDVCRRPIGGVLDTLTTFCGDCTPESAAVCKNTPAPIQCFTVEQGETEAKITDCDEGERYCKGPNFVTATGYSSMEQKCGECTGGEILRNCKECNTDGCNIKKELEDMMCNEYEWKTDKWVKKMEGVTGSETEVFETCKKFQGEDDVCRRPIGGVDDTLRTFCGDCTDGSTVCTNTPAIDSGAKGVAATISTLIAVLFVIA